MLIATIVLLLQTIIGLLTIKNKYNSLEDNLKKTFLEQIKKGRYYVIALFVLGGLIVAFSKPSSMTIKFYGPAFLGFFIAMYKELIDKLRSWSFPPRFIQSTHIASIIMLAGIIYFVVNVYFNVFS